MAHSIRDGEDRRAGIARGRAAVATLRDIRAEGFAAALPPVPEPRARRTIRLVGWAGLAAALVAGTVLAAHVAQSIGSDLSPGPAWLAGQFDSLAEWWSRQPLLGRVLIGAGIAALVALSGGSLTLAFGLSGVATYAAEHGHGAADFIRDPGAATRSWLNTTTPAGLALELAEFGLTFAPGNFGGGLAGRELRTLLAERRAAQLMVEGRIADLATAVPGETAGLAVHAGSADPAVLTSIFQHEYADISRVNAGRFVRGVDGYTMNCSTCVVATDRTLAGVPTVAGPVYTAGAPVTDVTRAIGGTWSPVSDYGVIVQRMTDAGPGARGIVWGRGTGRNPGHVFNVVHDTNGVVFIDGQTGTFARLESFARLYLMRSPG